MIDPRIERYPEAVTQVQKSLAEVYSSEDELPYWLEGIQLDELMEIVPGVYTASYECPDPAIRVGDIEELEKRFGQGLLLNRANFIFWREIIDLLCYTNAQERKLSCDCDIRESLGTQLVGEYFESREQTKRLADLILKIQNNIASHKGVSRQELGPEDFYLKPSEIDFLDVGSISTWRMAMLYRSVLGKYPSTARGLTQFQTHLMIYTISEHVESTSQNWGSIWERWAAGLLKFAQEIDVFNYDARYVDQQPANWDRLTAQIKERLRDLVLYQMRANPYSLSASDLRSRVPSMGAFLYSMSVNARYSCKSLEESVLIRQLAKDLQNRLRVAHLH